MRDESEGIVSVYLEAGKTRVIAGALDWPGWCRAGRDENAALGALLAYGPRYARVVSPARLGFRPPREVSALVIAERLTGNATTDFGAPGIAPESDGRPVDDTELGRLQAALKACWRSMDGAAEAARGRPLRLGPRGGGRALDKILGHVSEAEVAYLSALGGKAPRNLAPADATRLIRDAMLAALEASARGEIAERGPRGGRRWSLRYFARREAWHVLDHVWEIEDRMGEGSA